MTGWLQRRWPAWLALVSVAVLLLAGNALADRDLADMQLDLTEAGLFTVSPGTRQMLSALAAPITLRLFVSDDLGREAPALAAYADRVRDTLRRYAEASRGRLRLELVDPAPFSAREDQAVADGLQGVSLTRGATPVYFGLVGTDSADGRRSIAFFDPARERFLDYDLTRLILALAQPRRPVVGVLSPLALDGDQAGRGAWIAMDQLRQAFDVRRVATDATAIDPALDVLMVAHPQHLPTPTLFAIDQFVMRGGRLLALVDPLSEAQAASDPAPADTASDLEPLLSAWGVAFDPAFVVGDLPGAWRVRDAQGMVEAWPAWFNVGPDDIARDDPATGDLDQVTLASAGALHRRPGAAIAFTPLLQSSAAAALLPVASVRAGADPAVLLAAFHPVGGRLVLAARVRGMLHSAFAGPPPGAGPGYVAATRLPANLVVVADSDVLADRFWVRTQGRQGQPVLAPFSDNGAFIINLVGTLAGGDALLGLHGKGGGIRPLARIDAMQDAAAARLQQTEQALHHHLDAVRTKLDRLRAGDGAGSAAGRAIVTSEQQHLIDQLTDQVAQTQDQLRAVQRGLREDIDRLEFWVRVADIGGAPLLLVCAALGLAVWRRRALAA